MTITDEMVEKAHVAFHLCQSVEIRDAMRAALEAVAPMLIVQGRRDYLIQLSKENEELARALLEIAELAMPDTYFETDSRCKKARAILARAQELYPE